jgi:hypothetical protein
MGNTNWMIVGVNGPTRVNSSSVEVYKTAVFTQIPDVSDRTAGVRVSFTKLVI